MASSNLRSRPNATHSNPNGTSPSSSSPAEKPSATDEDEGPSRISVLDVLRVLAGLILLSSALSYFITGNSVTWNYRPAFTKPARVKAWLVLSLLPPFPP